MPKPKPKLGVRWPDYEVPIDRGVVRAFVQAVDELGFDHVTAFDHIAGMSPRTRRGWRMDYTTDMEWAESLTLLSHMTAISDSLGFMTAILGLPNNRPTVLVAKQVATIDRMSEGRFRLGVGLGWNDIEFAMMGTSFEDRAERLEEQVTVLRALWSKEEVLFRGRFHHLPSVGLSLAPVQRPVPIWMAATLASGPKVLRRIARLADGIIPEWAPADAAEKLDFIYEEARKVGRDPDEIGTEPKIALRGGQNRPGTEYAGMKSDEELASELEAWSEIGVSHIEFKSRSCGLNTVEGHLREIARFKEIADSVLG